MGRRRKPPAEGEPEEMIARSNIEGRLAIMFPRATGPTQQHEGLSKLSGVGEETIRRFMNGESSMTLRNLQAITQALGLSIVQLFTADQTHSMDGPQAGDVRGRGSRQSG